jgi:hypothetical protein
VAQPLPALGDGDGVAVGLVWARVGLGLVAGAGLVLVGHGLVGLGLAETVPGWPTGAGTLFVPPARVTPVPPGIVTPGFVPLVPGLAAIAGPAPGLLPRRFARVLPSGDGAGFGGPWLAEGDGEATVGLATRPSGTGRGLCAASGHGVNGTPVLVINPNATTPR